MSERFMSAPDGSLLDFVPDRCGECGHDRNKGTLRVTHTDGTVETVSGEAAYTIYNMLRISLLSNRS